MKCLSLAFSFDIFMDNYFTSFCLLTHLGVNNIRAIGVLSKNRLHKCTIIGDKQLQKKGTWPLWTAYIKQRSSVTLAVIDYNDSSAVYIAYSESCEPKRFVRCWKKLKKTIFKNNNQTNSTVSIGTWALSIDWTRTWPSTGFVSEWNNDVVLCLCEW